MAKTFTITGTIPDNAPQSIVDALTAPIPATLTVGNDENGPNARIAFANANKPVGSTGLVVSRFGCSVVYTPKPNARGTKQTGPTEADRIALRKSEGLWSTGHSVARTHYSDMTFEAFIAASKTADSDVARLIDKANKAMA